MVIGMHELENLVHQKPVWVSDAHRQLTMRKTEIDSSSFGYIIIHYHRVRVPDSLRRILTQSPNCTGNESDRSHHRKLPRDRCSQKQWILLVCIREVGPYFRFNADFPVAEWPSTQTANLASHTMLTDPDVCISYQQKLSFELRTLINRNVDEH